MARLVRCGEPIILSIMPYRTDLTGPYFRVWFSDVVTGRDLRGVAEELREHERELGRVPDRLVDMSGMLATGGTFNLAILTSRVRAVQRFPNSFRSALVSPRVEVTAFARIYRTLNRNPQITVEVFESVEAAEAWLGRPA